MGSMTAASAARTLGAIALLPCALFAGGCAWHTADAEHYFGPVWFRYSSGDAAHVRQTRRFGLLLEGGGQWSLMLFLSTAVAFGCGTPRLLVATGTTIGLKATPGDGQASPPQVTLAYKRSEVAVVPTPENPEERVATRRNDTSSDEAFSILSVFGLRTIWFGKTSVRSFIATGHAAREVQK